MTLLCPACGAAVTAATGPSAACPKCGAVVAVPTAYSPSVHSGSIAVPEIPANVGSQWTADRPPPPPGFVPPKSDKGGADPLAATASDTGSRTCGVSLPPAAIAWVPAAGLWLAVVLACFPWVGAYPGGVRVFSQNGWEAWTGSYTANALTEAVPDLKAADAALKAAVRGSAVLWLYFPLLLLAVLAATADRLVTNPDTATLPGPLAWLPRVWPVRHRILAGLAAVLLGLLLLEKFRGFGLENGLQTIAATKVETDAKPAETDNGKVIARVKAGMELARFDTDSGNAAGLVFAVHALVLLAAGYRVWRGPGVGPRFELSA